MEKSGNSVLSATTVQSFSSIQKSLQRYSIFCDFTAFCVHNVTLQVILNYSATKSAITIKYTPFFSISKALSNKLIKNFVSYTL